MTGADIRYDGGPHPLVGQWAPDLEFDLGAGPIRLAELTATGRPLLVDLTADSTFAAQFVDDQIFGDRIEVVTGRAQDAGTPVALLLRPDGYVAWAAETGEEGERDALRDAVARWFGVQGADQRPLTIATR
jgi:hypothetical protein